MRPWSLVLLLGCASEPAPAPAPVQPPAPKEAPAAPMEGDDEAPEVELRRPEPVDEGARVRALEAEVAALRRQIADGARPDPWASLGLVNAHEHLYALRHLDRYLQAARRAGVAATVVVASPTFTLEGKGPQGEPSMSENFEEVLAAAAAAPGEILPFCTLDPKDPDKLSRLQAHVAAGARGVKLYSGHSNFADGPLIPPDMEPVLDWLEAQGLPVNWHINLKRYGDELKVALDRWPRLNVMVPHYGVAFWRPRDPAMKQLETLLAAHPNLYVDSSLGTREILLKGMAVMEQDLSVFHNLFHRFPKQILWGTDSVITGNPEKTPGWYLRVLWATRDQLERDVFQTDLAAGYSRYYQTGRDGEGVYRGLGLDEEALRLIYHENPLRWLRMEASALKPQTGSVAP